MEKRLTSLEHSLGETNVDKKEKKNIFTSIEIIFCIFHQHINFDM